MGYTLLPQAIGTLFMNQVSQKPYPTGWHMHHPPPAHHFKIRSVGPGTRKICIGQCFSYYAPGTRTRKDLTDKRVKYCDTCKPSLGSWTKVSLNCTGAKHLHMLAWWYLAPSRFVCLHVHISDWHVVLLYASLDFRIFTPGAGRSEIKGKILMESL